MSLLFFKALHFGETKHKGQIRKGSKLPYFTHPLRVADRVSHFKTSKNLENLLCAALLHDTLEDTETSYEEIETEFNPMIASIVKELTSDDVILKQMGKNEYLKQKMVQLSSYGLFLKLVDRLDNICDAPREKYVHDTVDMMGYIRKNAHITASQDRVITAILKKCEEILK